MPQDDGDGVDDAAICVRSVSVELFSRAKELFSRAKELY